MSNMRCPMCAKSNPAEAETCKFCGARLRPLGASPAPLKGEEDELGWLRGLSSQGAKSGPPSASGPEQPNAQPPASDDRAPGEDTPTWLSRIRQRSSSEPDAVSPIGRDPLSEPPPAPPQDDWMAGLRPLGGMELPVENAPAAAQPDPADDSDDWLNAFNSRLGSSSAFMPPPPEPAAPPPVPAAPAAEPAQAIDMPDWLKEFGGFEALENGLPPVETPQRGVSTPPPAASVETPRWGVSTPPPGEPAASTPPPAEPAAIPDWLANFDAGQPPAPAETPRRDAPTPPADALPDWLARLDADSPPAPAPAAPQPAPSRSGGVTDWLSSLGAESAPEPESAPAPEPAAGMPAWLSSLDAASPLAGSGDDLPDWLSGFASAAPPAAGETPRRDVSTPGPAEELPAAEMPDWLSGFASAAPPEAGETPQRGVSTPGSTEELPAAEMPDWLAGFAAAAPPAAGETPRRDVGETPQRDVSTPGPAEELPAAELPDWLREMAPPAAVETPRRDVSTPPQAPDWFNEPGPAPAPPAPESGPALPAAPLPEPQPDADLSNWLKSLETRSLPDSAPAPLEPVQAPAAGDENLEWLQGYAAAPAPAEAGAEAQPGEIPDWLSSFSLEGQQPAGAPALPESLPHQPAFEGLPADAAALPAEDLPDWLKPAAAEPAAGQPAAAPAQPSVSPFSQEGLPEWMVDGSAPREPAPARLVDRSAEHLTTGPAHPFAGDEIPEWLARPEGEAAPAQAAAPSQEGLEQVQLPSWVQAMRPLESAAPGASPQGDDQRVEKSGPLAGLRGILPGEDLVAAYHKPPVYTARLHVSDKQQAHAALLEGLLGSENKAQEVPADVSQAPRYFVRLLTAVALIAMLLILLLTGLPPLEPEGLAAADPQVGVLNNLVNGLELNAPVLVAVEYEAGLQGEMKVAALPVINHLMARNVRLVVVSTNPAGPLLGEMLLGEALKNNPAYPAAQKQANLGYLVGGSTALKQFASAPLQNSIPQVWTAGAGWNSGPALAGLTRITDFKLILLLTDNPETGRAWVEQVQPEIQSRLPLAVISSAQAAPMLRPYQASGQVQVLISGLVGGAAYEQLRHTPGYSSGYWNAFQAGTLAAVLFLLMGGIVLLLFRSSPKSNAKK